jgi:hypothetical protein
MPRKDFHRLRKSEASVGDNKTSEHSLEPVMRVNRSTIGLLTGWGQFSTILQSDSLQSVSMVDCDTGSPAVLDGLGVSGGLLFRSDLGVEMKESFVICLQVGEDKEEITIVMEEREEVCEQVGWCSQFQDEAECGRACHQVTRQRCRSATCDSL